MVVSGIVKKDANEPLGRIHQRERCQQRDRSQGVNRRRFDHTGCARFQIDGAVNVQSLSPAGLFKTVAVVAAGRGLPSETHTLGSYRDWRLTKREPVFHPSPMPSVSFSTL